MMAYGASNAAPVPSSPPPADPAVGAGPSRHSPCPLLCPRQTRPPSTAAGQAVPWWKSWTKKYVVLCCICGGTAVLLGVIFIAIYFTLHYYTSSLQYFETIPTYAPAVVLIITGLLVMCFARRRNRYAYLIKLAGGCCLVCAVLCVVITVTTTVIHMNRLQTLRECVYTQKSKTCTCFAGIGDDDGTPRYVFNNTPDCEVVHGSLYTCLRAMFGLSVIGILVCIFSSMLVYQLLSHEKKKMYWEQLEMRRRYFYRQPTHPMYCNCYDDYGFAAPHGVYHWQPWEINSDRCWPTRGMAPRIGFSGEDDGSQRSILVGSTGHRASGWNWLPWSRNRNRQQRALPPGQEGEAGRTVDNADRHHAPGAAFSDGEVPEGGSQESPRLPLFAVHPYWSVETRFGPRRNGRRHRSNDAVFHHLNMTPPTRYHHQPPYVGDSGFATGPPLSFSTYGSLSRHMWGPPPPYSRPTSAENFGAARDAANTPTRTAGEAALPAYQERHQPHLHHHSQNTLGRPDIGRVAIIGDAAISGDHICGTDASTDASKFSRTLLASQFATNIILSSATSNEDGSYSSDYDTATGSKRMCLQSSRVADVHHHLQPDRSFLLPLGVHENKVNGSSTVPSQRVAKLLKDLSQSDHLVSSKSVPRVWATTSDTGLGSACQMCHELSLPVNFCENVLISNDNLNRNGTTALDCGIQQTKDSMDCHLDGCELTPDSYPSPSTDNCTTSSASFDPEEEPKSASNFNSGSMVVSTTPSTPVNGSTYMQDMECARSLPNLNLSLGITRPVRQEDDFCQNLVNGGCHHPIGTKDHFDNDVLANKVANNHDVDHRHTCANFKMPSNLSDSLLDLGGTNRSKIPFSGLSESSPTLPLSVPALLQSDKRMSQVSTLKTIFANYSESAGGTKSKSLGNLSPPSDDIIVTFKSIHV